MDDSELMQQITSLVNEEHHLTNRSQQEGGLNEEERARMHQLEVRLDELWDLMRQRRARRNAGENPDEATIRSESTVENYLQ